MKKTNDVLMEKVTKEFEKITKDVDWYLKNHVGYTELEGSYIYYIDKPHIETRFCFGHGQNGISTEEEYQDAKKSAEYAATRENYFINENLYKLNKLINNIKNSHYNFIFPKYSDEYNVNFVNVYSDDYMPHEGYFAYFAKTKIRDLTPKDKEQILASLEIEKAKFTKRLNTYLKKYGLSKINTWTYLVD